MNDSLFTRQQFTTNPRMCFVVMPFDPTLNALYDTIEDILHDYSGMRCVRVDKIARPGQITEDIWRFTNEARFLIADLTGNNPNVFYELGIAHALNKRVILLTKEIGKLPFDIKGMRVIEYSSNLNPKVLRQDLLKYMRECIETIPSDLFQGIPIPFFPNSYNPYFTAAPVSSDPRVRLTYIQSPRSIPKDQTFTVTLKARNDGGATNQGYFSISFPDGVEDLRIVDSNANIKIGTKGDSWANGRVVLDYPIAEALKYDDNVPVWDSFKEYYLKVQGVPKRSGFMWFYVSASCYDKATNSFKFDPSTQLLEIDQRGENVYCGIIDVSSS